MSIAEPLHELPVDELLPAVADAEFDRMAALTRRIIGAPIAMVSLPNNRCQVFPGAIGLPPEVDAARSTGLEYSYCQYVVRSAEPLIIRDMLAEPQFAEHLSTIEFGVRAYAGMPLLDDQGGTVGSLCVLDLEPRDWSEQELELLADLAAACSSQLQLRAANARAAVSAERDRIGQEFGQGAIRELFGLSMSLGSLRSQVDGPAAQELSRAIESVDDVIFRIRNSIFDVAR